MSFYLQTKRCFPEPKPKYTLPIPVNFFASTEVEAGVQWQSSLFFFYLPKEAFNTSACRLLRTSAGKGGAEEEFPELTTTQASAATRGRQMLIWWNDMAMDDVKSESLLAPVSHEMKRKGRSVCGSSGGTRSKKGKILICNLQDVWCRYYSVALLPSTTTSINCARAIH